MFLYSQIYSFFLRVCGNKKSNLSTDHNSMIVIQGLLDLSKRRHDASFMHLLYCVMYLNKNTDLIKTIHSETKSLVFLNNIISTNKKQKS